MKLKYIGNGDFLAGVPSRDLDDKEAKELGEKRLLESGLYEEIKEPKKTQKLETPMSGDGGE